MQDASARRWRAILFKEARRRRRRRWIAGALCVTIVGVGAGVSTSVLSSTPGSSRPASQRGSTPSAALGPPPCRHAQLDIGVSGLTGAAIYTGVVISYTDTSTRSCRLEGYPGITGVTATAGTEVTARHELAGYLGGLSGKSAFIRVPPTLVLCGRGAAASSMVEWSSVSTYTDVSPRCIGVGHHGGW